MDILSAIARFIGKILKEILPGLLKAGKKPTEVKPAGHDKELKEDIDNSIEQDINEMIDDRNEHG